MKKIVYCVYDKVTDIFDDLALFGSYELAYGSYRRTFRDMYLKGHVTRDALRDYVVYGVGTFDSKTGVFESWQRSDWIEINLFGLLSDLSEKGNENEVSD